MKRRRMVKSKIVTISALTIMLLLAANTAMANIFIAVADSTTNSNFFPGGPTSGYLISGPDWGWTHTLTYEGGTPPASITSATLDIKQFGVLLHDEHEIFLDGVSLEYLDNCFYYEQSHTTTFVLGSSALTNLMDGTSNMWIDIDWPNSVALYSSTLTIEYESVSTTPPQDPDPDPTSEPTIPAPGAVLLSSIGMSLVGQPRRKKTL
jgi:hypothetical protein